jgi:HK97 family phage major capsid protein
MKIHEMQEARAQAVTAMRSLADAAENEKRDLTADEDTRFGVLKTTISDLDKKIGRAQALADAERGAPAIIHGRLGDGQYEHRAREFSLVKAINARLGEGVDAGFEKEISAEVQRRAGRKFAGIAVPDQYFHVQKRTLLVGSSAAELYPEQHRADLFIDALRANLVVGRLGATILDGLIGAQDIPRQTGSSTAQWVAEDASLSETDADFDDVTLTPRTVGAVTSYSRRTLINAVPSIENIVRNDLTAVIANAIDYAAMFGTGTDQPTGITGSGALLRNLNTPTWAQVLAFISGVQGANADIGSLGWAMAPDAIAKLRSTAKVSSTDSAMIMQEPTSLAGYAVVTTTAMTTGDSPDKSRVIFGAWSQLLVGYWSGVDVLANPFEGTAYLKGRVLLRVMRDVDVAVRHPESFAYAVDVAP